MTDAGRETAASPTPPTGLRSLIHPTDLTPEAVPAFAHALKLAVAARAHLWIVHTDAAKDDIDWDAFPHVRETLGKWGLLEADAPASAVEGRLGVRVGKIDVVDRDVVRGVADFANRHPSDLLVMATHAREGLDHWLHRSVAEPVARRTRLPTLFLPRGARGLVDAETGEARLRRVLVPVAHDPSPVHAVHHLSELARLLGAEALETWFLHVGADGDAPGVPRTDGLPGRVETIVRRGDAVEAVAKVAAELDVDLIAMTTEGHAGVFDALLGGATERVLRRAGRPLLAAPPV